MPLTYANIWLHLDEETLDLVLDLLDLRGKLPGLVSGNRARHKDGALVRYPRT